MIFSVCNRQRRTHPYPENAICVLKQQLVNASDRIRIFSFFPEVNTWNLCCWLVSSFGFKLFAFHDIRIYQGNTHINHWRNNKRRRASLNLNPGPTKLVSSVEFRLFTLYYLVIHISTNNKRTIASLNLGLAKSLDMCCRTMLQRKMLLTQEKFNFSKVWKHAFLDLESDRSSYILGEWFPDPEMHVPIPWEYWIFPVWSQMAPNKRTIWMEHCQIST